MEVDVEVMRPAEWLLHALAYYITIIPYRTIRGAGRYAQNGSLGGFGKKLMNMRNVSVLFTAVFGRAGELIRQSDVGNIFTQSRNYSSDITKRNW